MASITCGNCGGQHATVADVRSCHTNGPSEALVDSWIEPVTSADQPAHAGTLVELAGPEPLARWLIVGPGATAPAPWHEALRVVVDDPGLANPSALLATLEPRWMARQRTVIEWAVSTSTAPAERESRLPWELSATFTFPGERLWHLLWSNSVDARADTPVGPGPDTDGVWADGGPFTRHANVTVRHQFAYERGRLNPIGLGAPTANLAPDQLAAVSNISGVARIIAPAGSGKTRVLTERARHLLRDWGIPASAMTLVAFNVRAAAELRERTTDLPDLQIRTLNALALSIAQRGAPRRLTTIDERDVRRILDGLVTFPRKASTDPAAVWIEALSQIRLGLKKPSDVEAAFGGDVPGLADMFPAFREALADRAAVDFDEQIVAALVTLLTKPDVRAACQRENRLLLVDEFQDLAPAHLLLVRLLASPALCVYGVGDDDQTIYGYAGATPEWLIGFDQLFPGAISHPLEVNYRCPPAIVHAASNLLTRNRRRVPKVIRAAEGRADDPAALRVVASDDSVGAAVSEIKQLINAGTAPADIAVLSRVTASLAPVQVALHHAGIATNAPIDERYLDRTGVRAVLSWLQLALQPDRLKASDLSNTIRRPPRGLSPKVIDWLCECRDRAAIARLAGRLNTDRDSDKVSGYLNDIVTLAGKASRGATTLELITMVRDRVGLDEALAKLDLSRADSQSTHLDDLDALVGLARLQPEPDKFAGWLADQLKVPGDANGVMLASIHKVKGREWPHVIVHDVRDGVLPHRLADDREEERRVFHVAITRASVAVVVLTDKQSPSPFLKEFAEPGQPAPLRRIEEPLVTPRPKGSAARASGPSGDPGLREALRQWRVERAKADDVPSFVVFSNVTLDELAATSPIALDQLTKISGIGPVKAERYGSDIVRIVRTYLGVD